MNIAKASAAFLFSVGIFSSTHATEICTAIADTSNGQVLFERGDCKQQVTPASTFKIAISLMGYDSGFLNKVVNRQLGVSQHAYDMTAEIMKFKQSPGGWEIHGKTGAASGYGWYVEWASKGRHTRTFARLIRKEESDPQDIPAGVLARDAFIAEYPALVIQLVH